MATLVLSFAGLVLQAAAFLGLVAFVQASQTDWTITLFGLHIPVGGTVGGLVAFALVLLAALGLSAACQYGARLVAVRLALSYEQMSARRAAHVIATRRFGTPGADGVVPDDRTLQTLLTRGPRYLGRARIELLNAVTPLTMSLLAGAAMLYWQPLFTLALFGVLAISAPFHLLVIRAGMTSSRDLSAFARADTLAKVDVLNALRKRPIARPEDVDWIDERLSGELSQRYMDAYGIRLRVAHMSSLVSNLTMALILFVLALYFGNVMLRGDDGIAHVLLYVVALRYFLGGTSAALKTFTTINIFYVFFQRYLRDIGTRPHAPPPSAPLAETDWLALIRPAHDAAPVPDNGRVIPRPGHPVTLICTPPLNWLTLPDTICRLLGTRADQAPAIAASAAVVAADYPAVSDDLAACLSLPDDFDLDRLLADWPEFAERLQDFRAVAAAPWSAADWPALGADLKFLFALDAATRRSSVRILVIDEVALRPFRPPELVSLWERLEPYVVIIAYRSVPGRLAHLKHGELGVVRNGHLAWCGRAENFGEQREALVEVFEGAPPPEALLAETELDELDL
jgi:hypothetical protein